MMYDLPCRAMEMTNAKKKKKKSEFILFYFILTKKLFGCMCAALIRLTNCQFNEMRL